MKFLHDFFTRHPELREQYVDTSITALNYLAKPLDLFMQHLLVIQNIDPKTRPGERYQSVLSKALDKTHEKDFDDNYDFSWIRKSFQKTQNALPNLNMTPAQYHKATDIGSLESPPAKEDSFFTNAAAEDPLQSLPLPPPLPLPPYPLNVTGADVLTRLAENYKETKTPRINESNILEKMKKYVDYNREYLNKDDKAVQLESRAPSEFKELISAIKKYRLEHDEETNAVKSFKQMVSEAEEAVEAPGQPAISLKEALQTIVKLAKTVENSASSPVSKFVKHRDGNTLIRKEEINKGRIKRFSK